MKNKFRQILGTGKCLCFIIGLVAWSNDTFSQKFLFDKDDRVCFVGNSITMDGRFHNYIELFYVTRFPDKEIKFYNCGISGDVSEGILKRADSDVLIYKPTWSVLMIGMNDVGRSLYSKERKNEPGIKLKQQDAIKKYMANVDSIIRKLISTNSKVILQTPSIYDQTADMPAENDYGVNDALKTCANYLKKMGKKFSLPVVDFWTVMRIANEKVQKLDPAATIISSDRVHPGEEGHFLMAVEFLKTQKVPGYVSFVSINAKKNAVDKSFNAKLSELKCDAVSVSFSSFEAALPFPLLSEKFDPDSLVSFTNNFNKEILQIRSLNAGNYLLKIDSIFIGEFSDGEFSLGVNLSIHRNTPQFQQSVKVLNLLQEYWALERKIRQIKFIEYQFLAGKVDLQKDAGEGAKRFLDEKLEQYKNESSKYFSFYKRNFEAYFVNKPIQNDFEERAENLFKEIQKQNKPSGHIYTITKMDQ